MTVRFSSTPEKAVALSSFFLDSGAHSLYVKYVRNEKGRNGYTFYKSREFWDYVDNYAQFVLQNKAGIDYYANVDVIYNPEESWKVLKYLEQKYKLNPVPVIHGNTPLSWVEKHLAAGYTYLGIGGLGQGQTAREYCKWADRVFDLLCSNKDRLPCVKTHGFAMTSYGLMKRYPWWSVDSSSWAKSGAFGNVYVPHRRAGKFTFEEAPYNITFSEDAPSLAEGHAKCWAMLSPNERLVVCKWLDEIEVPLGESRGDAVIAEGVINHYGSRGVANLRFFKRFADSLPAWPWPFKPRKIAGGFFS